MAGKYFEEVTVGQTLVHGIRRTVTVAFPKPVFAGDTIRAQTKVAVLRDSKSRPNQGIVTFERPGFNRRDEVIATCRRVALMLRRPA